MGKNSWLVLASSSAVEAVDSAMRPTWDLCQSRSRVRAWKIQDSLVWLDPKGQWLVVGAHPRRQLRRPPARSGDQMRIAITGRDGQVVRSLLERVNAALDGVDENGEPLASSLPAG